jgi:hypothetical protein
MYPDATTSAVQTDPQALRPRGGFMNWKRFSKALIGNAAWFGAFITLLYGVRGVLHLRPLIYVTYSLVVIAVSLANEGTHKLKSIGQLKSLRIHGISLSIFIVSFLVLGILGFGHSFLFDIVAGVMLVLCLSILPLALYLNRKQSKSTSQSKIVNAS